MTLKTLLPFLLFPFLAFGQTTVKIQKAHIQTVGGTEYFVTADTTSGGKIVLTLLPAVDMKAELERQVGVLDSDIAGYTAHIDQIQAEREAARQKRKEVQKLLNQLKNRGTAAPKTAKKQ